MRGQHPHDSWDHAGRGGPMKAKATALLLADLGVTRSHNRPHTSKDKPFLRSLMWTAPEVASRIRSAGARPLAPPMSAVSPVRSLLAAGPRGDIQHDRAAPARRRALPLSGCLPGWRAGCPATPETGPGCPPTSAPRQPTVPVDCADRQADGIGQPPAASSAQLRQ